MEIKTVIQTAEGPNGEDIVQTLQDGKVIKEEYIYYDDKGEEVRRRPKSIRPEKIEVNPNDAGTIGAVGKDAPKPLTALEMAELAIKTRANTIGKKVEELLGKILAECVKHVLDGEYEYKVDESVSGDILIQTLKELKSRGYKAKRWPEPGQGTYIEVKWPTKTKKSPVKPVRKKRVKKELKAEENKPTP